jgi:competence protein ComEC
VVKGRARRHFNGGDSDVHVLNLRNCPEESDTFDLNDRSLVLKVTYGKTSFLIPGDISEAAEEELVRRNGPILRSQVLVAPHHGSARSSSQAFIKAVRPETVVFSSGAGNVFRLPHPDALARYNRIGCRIFRTDLNGAVTIQTDGQNVAARPFRGL